MNKKPGIDVILSPALIPYMEVEGKVAVIIDILRATTTICEALHNGAEAIIPVNTVEEAATYRDSGMLAAAERNGLVYEGFELGNSPVGFNSSLVKGKTIALTTTNGTKALLMCSGASEIIIGSFFNLESLCSYLINKQKNTVLVCAGWKDKFNLEDTVFAGAVVDGLQDHFNTESDASVAAKDLYTTAKNDLISYLRKCNHAQRFERLGIDDLEYCIQLNRTPIVPVFRKGKIMKSGSHPQPL